MSEHKETIHIRRADDSGKTWCGERILQDRGTKVLRFGCPYEGDCDACLDAFSAALVESIRNA